MYEQPYNPFLNNLNIIKDYFKSKQILALAILNIASIVMSVITSIFSTSLVKDIVSAVADFLSKNTLTVDGKTRAMDSVISALRDASASSSTMSIFGSVSAFTILTIVSLFIIYVKCNSTKSTDSPAAGVTLMYVIAIISLVGSVIAVIGILILTAALFVLYAQFKNHTIAESVLTFGGYSITVNDTLMLALAIAFTLLFIIVAVVTLFYTISRVRYIGSIRQSMNSVELSRKGAKPYGVFCVIMAVSSVVNILTSISSLIFGKTAFRELGLELRGDYTLIMILSILSSIVMLAIVILQAKIALGYANYIDDKKYGYSEPASSAPYAPINAGVGATRTQQNPYSYLAQPKTEAPANEQETFTNPYLDTQENDAPAQQATTCPNCGAPADGSAPFCGNCGAKLP